MFHAKLKSITSLSLLSLVLLTLAPASTRAQDTSRTFPETGKTVSGIFLQYWHAHGGLAQQGYPISDEILLRSTDGKEYKTQFFERAVFEHHPEYASTENEVLLKLVGQTFYDRHFGNTPPPNQSINPTNTFTFKETGQAIGGKFRAYWEAHGGLAQQGYPMTDEFRMVSTDGKEYTTQVFQRAVFELHPEYAGTENEVLLRLLGVEEWAELNKPAPTQEQTSTPTSQPTETPKPKGTLYDHPIPGVAHFAGFDAKLNNGQTEPIINPQKFGYTFLKVLDGQHTAKENANSQDYVDNHLGNGLVTISSFEATGQQYTPPGEPARTSYIRRVEGIQVDLNKPIGIYTDLSVDDPTAVLMDGIAAKIEVDPVTHQIKIRLQKDNLSWKRTNLEFQLRRLLSILGEINDVPMPDNQSPYPFAAYVVHEIVTNTSILTADDLAGIFP